MRTLLSIGLLFFSLSSQGQFSDSVTHHLRVAASGNINRSNSAAAYLLNNDARFSIKNKRTVFNTNAVWTYGEQNATLTNNDFSSSTDFNIYPDSSKLYYWGLANYTTSFSLRIQHQVQTGLGAAYNFINRPEAWLNISDGILYETSRLTAFATASQRYHTFRNSLRLGYRFVIQGAVRVEGTNFLQQALGDAGDYILRTNNSLSVKLSSWVSIGTTLTYNQFRRTGTDNLLLTYGIIAERFF